MAISSAADDFSVRIAAINAQIAETQTQLNDRKKAGDAGQEIQAVKKRLQTARDQLSDSGPPAPALFAALVEGIVEKAPPPHKTVLQAALAEMQESAPDVLVCRLEGCNDKALTKLIWRCCDFSLDKAIVAVISATETAAKLMRGTAGLGYLAEDLSDWIQALRLVV